jgi:adenosine deaminase
MRELLSKKLKKITDQSTNQSILAEIAQEVYYLREEAFERITDQSILIDIAQNAEKIEVRIAAAKKLSDKSLAQEIFKGIVNKGFSNNDYTRERSRAVRAITDQAFLFTVIEYDTDIQVRRSAIKALTDKNLLQKIIDGGEEYTAFQTEFTAHDEAFYAMLAAKGETYSPPSTFYDLHVDARKRLAELENK